MKRILSLFITLCLLLTCVPLTGMAADEIISGTLTDSGSKEFSWSLNLTTGAFAIDGTGNIAISVANPWDPANSTTLIPWAYYGSDKTDYRSAIKSVTIGSGITSLGRELFYGCTSLEEVTIPGNVTITGWGTFKDCKSLKKATFGEGFKDLGDRTFDSCTSLTELNLPSTLVAIRQNVVQGCISLKNLVLPSRLTTINQNAFGNNNGGEGGAAVIPAPAGNIGHSIGFTVYAGSLGEEYIDTYYPESKVAVTEGEVVATGDIDGGAAEDTGIIWTLYDTNKLVISREKDASGKYIGTGKIPDNAENGGSMPWEASYRTTITKAEIGEGILHIGNRVFQSHSALTSVKMANTVTSMGTYVMNAAGKVVDVTLSERLSKIPTGTFNNNNNIKELTIPYNTAVDAASFRSVNQNLVLTVYEDSAAHKWAASGTTPGVTPNVGNKTYGLAYNVVPVGGSVNAEGGEINWTLKKGILNVTGSGKMKNLNIDATDQPWYFVRTLITEAYIGAGITHVGDRYFQSCSNLTKVEMADTVTGLGGYLFNAASKLTSVKLSRNIATGGDYLLYQVTSLPELTIPANMYVSAKTFARSGPDTVITIYAGGAAHRQYPDLTVTGVQNYDKTTGTRTLNVAYETESGTDGTTTWAWDYATKTITIGGSGATTSWHTVSTKMDTDGWHMNRGYYHYYNMAEKIVIGKDITKLGDYAFVQFTKVVDLEFEEGSKLATIGQYTFSNMKLIEVTLPATVETVMQCAFRAISETDTDTHTLVKFVVPGDNTAFYDTALSRQSNVVLYCNPGSEAEKFAIKNDIEYRYIGVDYLVTNYSKASKTATVLNSTEAEIEATVVFVNFDEDEITDVSVVPTTLAEGENEVTATADFTPSMGDIVIYLWDNMEDITPLAEPYYAKNTVWMLGDSIMADWGDGRYPQEGWGEAFKEVVTSDVTVVNRAISGFTAEGCYKMIWSTNEARSDWNPVRDEVCAGDYVIIAYLHNDYCAVADSGKNNGLYQSTEYIDTYKDYLSKIVDECEAKGAQIILVVPPNKGVTYNFHNQPVEGVDVGDYSAVIPALAAEKGVPCVNIHKWTMEEIAKDVNFLDTIYLTKTYLNGLVASGDVTEEILNNHSNAGIKKNRQDTTHLSVLGCKNIAEFVAAQLKTMDTGLEKHLK